MSTESSNDRNIITDEDRKLYGDLSSLSNGHLTDREVAAKVVWLERQDLNFIGVTYSARDRIMHLSVKVKGLEDECYRRQQVLESYFDQSEELKSKVADLEAQLAAAKADIAENDKVIADLRDGCEVCGGAKGGVPGNENIINGKRVCAYCT